MSDNIKILKNYILYFLVFIIVCIYGITHASASEYYLTYNDIQKYWDNNGSSVSAVGETWNQSLNSYVSNNITTTANSYGAGVSFNSPIPIINNHTYTISIAFQDRINIANSSKPNIALGISLDSASYNYSISDYDLTTIRYTVNNNSVLQYVFKANTGGSYLFIPWTTTYTTTQGYFMSNIIIDDLGVEGVTESAINNSLSNQTTILNQSILNSQNSIINNQNTNKQDILNNQNTNTNRILQREDYNAQAIITEGRRDADNIINNQNQNTQQEIESQKVCNNETILYNYLNWSDGTTGSYLKSDGTYGSNSNLSVSDYFKLKKDVTYNIEINFSWNVPNYCVYDSQKTLINCYSYSNGLLTTSITPTSDEYIRFSYSKSESSYAKITYDNCQNGNQALNDSLNDLNGSLNDDDSSGATSEASDFFSSFNTNTFGLTSIITAPLNLIQSVLSSTCTDLQLPLPYLSNKYLTLPCMSSIYSQHFGTFFTIYQTITYGIIAYWVCVRIFNQVKDFKNPEHDEIEVMDL